MATMMRSGGETLSVNEEFVHAMKALGWDVISRDEPAAPARSRRGAARSRKPAEEQEG